MRAVVVACLLGLAAACGGAQQVTQSEEELAQRIAGEVYERLLREGYLECVPEDTTLATVTEPEPERGAPELDGHTGAGATADAPRATGAHDLPPELMELQEQVEELRRAHDVAQ